jgi:hypothetical protein
MYAGMYVYDIQPAGIVQDSSSSYPAEAAACSDTFTESWSANAHVGGRGEATVGPDIRESNGELLVI